MLSRIRKWRQIDAIVRKSGWDELLEQALDAADQFHAIIATVPIGADRTKLARTMMLRDIVAHVCDMNFAVGSIIEGLGQSKPVKYNTESFYAGAGKKSWVELIKDHADSRHWLEETATAPVSSLRKNMHHLYGQMNAREWLGLTIRHYEYHTLQVQRILASDRFKKAAAIAAGTANDNRGTAR